MTKSFHRDVLKLPAAEAYPPPVMYEKHGGHQNPRARLWYLFKVSETRTMELSVQIHSMPNFCGGYCVSRPRVIIRDMYNTGTNKWNRDIGPSVTTSGEGGWKAFNQTEHSALDLCAITGKKRWEKEELNEYGFSCLAYAVICSLAHEQRRGVVGSDYVGGLVEHLFKSMAAFRGEGVVPANGLVMCGWVRNRGFTETFGNGWKKSKIYPVNIKFGDNPEWRNVNSGSMVRWFTMNYYFNMDDGCVEVSIPPHVGLVYNGESYRKHIP